MTLTKLELPAQNRIVTRYLLLQERRRRIRLFYILCAVALLALVISQHV